MFPTTYFPATYYPPRFFPPGGSVLDDFSVDAVIAGESVGTFPVDAALLSRQADSFAADAWFAQGATFIVDAYFLGVVNKPVEGTLAAGIIAGLHSAATIEWTLVTPNVGATTAAATIVGDPVATTIASTISSGPCIEGTHAATTIAFTWRNVTR